MIKIIVSFVFILGSYFCLAQDSLHAKRTYKNKVSLHWTYSDFPGLLPAFTYLKTNYNAPTQYSVNLERKIYKNFNAVIGFTKWNEATWFFKSSCPSGFSLYNREPVHNVGAIEYRKMYKMVDLLFSHKYDLKRHKIDLGVGASCYWGINTITDSIKYAYGHELSTVTSDHRAGYFGIVYMFNYDYLIFKNMIAIGIDVRYRKYIGYHIEQVDYGPHIAFVF